jgi:hypothetical protein
VSSNAGVAAAGDIRDSTIQIGLDAKETGEEIARQIDPLRKEFTALTVQIAREKGVEIAPLQAILVKLGEAGVPDHEIPARLDAAADELIDLRIQLTRLTNARPEFASIRNQALAQIDRGEFDAARATLGRGRDAACELREHASRNEAEFLADEARLDHLQLAYQSASDKYAQAANLVKSFDRDSSCNYLLKQANELFYYGQEFGERQALLEAVDVDRSILVLVPQNRAPLAWAATQNNLGLALRVLGERGDNEALRGAVAAFENALLERTRERAPHDWAATQNNLGTTLFVLGQHGDDEALRRAVAAYENALLEYTRECAPVAWAATQNNLGDALRLLGERSDGEALRRAVAAFENALVEHTRERAPLAWATTQNNLGAALLVLGERGDDQAVHGAVAAFEDALLERTRKRAPLAWAMTQNNLGAALRVLGDRGDEAALRRAIAAHENALLEYTRKRTPLDWGGNTEQPRRCAPIARRARRREGAATSGCRL